MARLTKAQTHALRRVLRNAERAQAYIMAPETAVARRASSATTSLHYRRESDGACLYEVERSYGSDLCGLETALGFLRDFLAEHGKPGA